MSEPETAAGRALLHAWEFAPQTLWTMPPSQAAEHIAAIETEARAAADAQLVRYSGIIGVIEHANAQGLTVHVATRGTCAAHIEAGDDTSEPVRADAALVAEKAVSRALAGAAITNAKELAAEKERVARLREGFTAYGQHQQPCAFGPTLRCICGYIDTLRSLTLGQGAG